MSVVHTVEQGEHLSGIIRQYGFADYQTIWNHPENEALRQQRDDPHVLYPGDSVAIPTNEAARFDRPTGQRHTFVLTATPLRLRILVRDFDHLPIPYLPCLLSVDGSQLQVSTDHTGLIEQEIPPDAKSGSLTIPDLDMEAPLLLGHLDPGHEESGWQARLVNLGYYAREEDGQDRDALAAALEEFQCDHALTVTGTLDEITKSRLVEIHGC